MNQPHIVIPLLVFYGLIAGAIGYRFAMRRATARQHLTAEQIMMLSYDPLRYRNDTSDGMPSFCAYCGAETKATAYTDLKQGKSWPACCSKIACMDKWRPLP